MDSLLFSLSLRQPFRIVTESFPFQGPMQSSITLKAATKRGWPNVTTC